MPRLYRYRWFFFMTAVILFPAGARAQGFMPSPTDTAHTSALDSIAGLPQKYLLLGGSLSKANNSLDSIGKLSNKALDSMQKGFHHGVDSLQKVYAASVKGLQNKAGKLNHKKDSLARLGLPTSAIAEKVDSLENAQKQKLDELNSEIGKLKSKTLSGVSSLHLPPEAQDGVASLTKNINGFSLPGNLSQFSLGGLKILGASVPDLNLPGNLASSMGGITSLQNPNLNMATVPQLSQLNGQAGNYAKQLNSANGMVSEQGIEKEALNIAGQNTEMKDLLKEETQIKGMGERVSQLKDTKKLDSAAMQQLKPAVDHFLGKEKELQGAMDKVSKLKQKYSSVASLKDLPRRAPNPLRGKPWYERTVVGLNYFVQSKSYALVDLNPYVGWKFNNRLTATIGWNGRVGISHWNLRTGRYDRVYGVRASVSYLCTRGITFKFAPEMMWAYVPTNLVLDTKHQAQIWGIYAGIRKDFPVYKTLKGYSEAMYNFNQKPFENIYGDKVVFRFGFELNFKKPKPKKKA